MNIKHNLCLYNKFYSNSNTVADLRGHEGHASPLGARILSISCSFWENLAKSYVGAPTGELVPPPRGNPGSATATDSSVSINHSGKMVRF